MSKHLVHARLALLALFLAGCVPRLTADTNAVTVMGGYTTAGAVVGAGFSFVPTTNLLVTGVSIYDTMPHGATVSFWTSTNTPIASFYFLQANDTGTVLQTNISFLLGAGEEYTITVQDRAASFGQEMSVAAYLPDSGSQITLAPELTGYHANLLTTNGQLVSADANAFLFGVNFSYQVTNLVYPPLSIQLEPSNTVAVSWSSPTFGFVLQENTNLTAENWYDHFTTTEQIGTESILIVSPATGSDFYRLRPN